MGNWVNKTFFWKSSVIAQVTKPDMHEITAWVRLLGNQIKVEGATYFITPTDFVLVDRNVPKYRYQWNVPEPINPKTNGPSYMSAQEYDTAISAGEAKKVFDALPKKGDGNTVITFVLLGVVILALGVLAYLGYQEIVKIIAIIEEIKQKLDIISGV